MATSDMHFFNLGTSNIHFTCNTDLSNMGSNAGNWKQKQTGKAPHGSTPGVNNRHINVAEPLLSVKCQKERPPGVDVCRPYCACWFTDLLEGKQMGYEWIASTAFLPQGFRSGNEHRWSMD